MQAGSLDQARVCPPGNRPTCRLLLQGNTTQKGIRGNVQRGMVACRRGSLAGRQHRARLSAHAPKPRCGRKRAAGV